MNRETKVNGSCERFTFLVLWQDIESSLGRKFTLHCYFDGSIELIDMKNSKVFLRRVVCDGVKISNISVGDVVDIYSRRMEVLSYGDLFTKNALESMTEKTVALIKADNMVEAANIIQTILNQECKITKMRMIQMSKDDASYFYQDLDNASDQEKREKDLVASPVIALEITGKNSIAKWQQVMGCEFPEEAHALVSNDKKIALYGSSSTLKYEKDKILFFVPKNVTSAISPMKTALFNDCTLAIIKPHAVLEGLYPNIILKIQNMKFKITAIMMYHMNRSEAEELLEVYRGVLPEFQMLIDQFVSGPCIGLEIVGFGSMTVSKFREIVGPRDPNIAKLLRPQSIRAAFGSTIAKNVIYCTDLDTDGVAESNYFFNYLHG